MRIVWNLREEILLFLEMKQIDCEFSSEIKKPEWVCDLALSVDIWDKLNEMNINKLQGKGVFAHELFVEIASYQVKLELFSTQLSAHTTLCISQCYKHRLFHKAVQRNTVSRYLL